MSVLPKLDSLSALVPRVEELEGSPILLPVAERLQPASRPADQPISSVSTGISMTGVSGRRPERFQGREALSNTNPHPSSPNFPSSPHHSPLTPSSADKLVADCHPLDVKDNRRDLANPALYTSCSCKDPVLSRSLLKCSRHQEVFWFRV